MIFGGAWLRGVPAPNVLKIVRKLVKICACVKKVDHRICHELFLATAVGRMVKTPAPTESVSAHLCPEQPELEA